MRLQFEMGCSTRGCKFRAPSRPRTSRSDLGFLHAKVRMGHEAELSGRMPRTNVSIFCVVSLQVVHCVPSSPLGPVVASFRALSGRLAFTVQRHKFHEDSLWSYRVATRRFLL